MSDDLAYTSQFRRRRAAQRELETAYAPMASYLSESTPAPSSGASYVRWVQAALNQILGLRLAVDGIAGTQTRSAIRSFQARSGLTVDGIVGPQTDAKLRAALGSGAPGARALGSPASAVAAAPRALPSPCGVPTPVSCGATVIDHFAQAKAVVEPAHEAAYRATIASVATCIATGLGGGLASGVIRIVGHTSTEGSTVSNDTLGQARADQVNADLQAALMARGLTVSTFFVAPVDGVVFLHAETRGESSLRISPERTEEDRKKNRRVEIDPSGLFRKPPGPAPAPAEVDTLIAEVGKTLGSLPLGRTGIVLPTAARFLDPAEQSVAMTEYRGSLDFTKILITNGLGYGGTKFTVAVQLSTGWHVAMNMGSLRCWAPAPYSATLVHELAHAWQSQHHGTDPTAFMANSVKCQAKAIALSKVTGKAYSAYAYVPGKAFGDYGSEQIAQQVQHHFTGRGSPTPAVVSTIQGAAANTPVAANATSLAVVVALELGAPGVIRP
jgi:peptidoglycan hydrolase-like protein with peptidoglycan-binding domain